MCSLKSSQITILTALAKSWCICATGLTFAALPQTAGATPQASANCNYALLPSTTIHPTSVGGEIASIAVPGENGIAQCVYEIVDDQKKLPAGTEDYCFCAGGPDVSAASAPLLTHSGTSASANAVTDCAYTTQPVPGWTPSVTGVSTRGNVGQSSTSWLAPTALETVPQSLTSVSAPETSISPSTCKVFCTSSVGNEESSGVTCACLCPGIGGNLASYYCTNRVPMGAIGRLCDPGTCESP